VAAAAKEVRATFSFPAEAATYIEISVSKILGTSIYNLEIGKSVTNLCPGHSYRVRRYRSSSHPE